MLRDTENQRQLVFSLKMASKNETTCSSVRPDIEGSFTLERQVFKTEVSSVD